MHTWAFLAKFQFLKYPIYQRPWHGGKIVMPWGIIYSSLCDVIFIPMIWCHYGHTMEENLFSIRWGHFISPRHEVKFDRDSKDVTLYVMMWSTPSQVVVIVRYEYLYFAPQFRSECSWFQFFGTFESSRCLVSTLGIWQ